MASSLCTKKFSTFSHWCIHSADFDIVVFLTVEGIGSSGSLGHITPTYCCSTPTSQARGTGKFCCAPLRSRLTSQGRSSFLTFKTLDYGWWMKLLQHNLLQQELPNNRPVMFGSHVYLYSKSLISRWMRWARRRMESSPDKSLSMSGTFQIWLKERLVSEAM